MMNETITKGNRMKQYPFGLIIPPSSANTIKIMAHSTAAGQAIIGKSIYTLVTLDDGDYLSLGLVTNITTFNDQAANSTEQAIISRNYTEAGTNAYGVDVRIATIKLQATFCKRQGSDSWSQFGSSLPTSPGVHAEVYILDEETIFDLIPKEEVSFLGYSHQSQVLSPYLPTKFSDASGAIHSAYFAKSGSGKSVLASSNMAINMQDIHRTIITIDPQGQWANEHGFLYSPQAFARTIGRPVEVMRVSEDIRLQPDIELIERLLSYSGVWAKFMKMSAETKSLLSTELAEEMVFHKGSFEISPQEVFQRFMRDLDTDKSRLNKIYAGTRKTDLRNRIRNLLHMPEVDDNGVELEFDPSETSILRAERDLKEIVNAFAPVHNLFSGTNFNGNKRHTLIGHNGKLNNILVAREETDQPAPYIIIDMSNNSADDETARYRKEVLDDDSSLRMTKLLGNNDVKTAILTYIFDEMTTIAEDAFNVGGNLNTEIVFDEAMRFAMPPGQAKSDIAKEFTENLAEYARDTRKFGIGWTYILQTPTGLNENIFKQLTNFYIGWGLSGRDLQIIGDQMDGKDYLDIYSSFAPPRSTKIYPFMLLGSTSPLVFTHTPTFIDGFNGMHDFLEHNSRWINALGTKYGKGTVTISDISNETGKKLQAESRKKNKVQKSSPEKKPSKLSVGSIRETDENEPTVVHDWTITTDEDPPF